MKNITVIYGLIIGVLASSCAITPSQCNPQEKNGIFTAASCELSGGYAGHNSYFRDKNTELTAKYSSLREDNLQLNQEKDNLQKEILSLQQEIDTLSNNLKNLEAKQELDRETYNQIVIVAKKLQSMPSKVQNLAPSTSNNYMASNYSALVSQANKAKSSGDRLVSMLIDVVVPSSPLDLIPLEKIWKIGKAIKVLYEGYNILDAMKSNGFMA